MKSDTDDSGNSKFLQKSVATHSWCHRQSFAAADSFLAEKQNSQVNHFYSLNARLQIHPCLNRESINAMVCCFAQGEKELEAEYQGVVGKRKEKV